MLVLHNSANALGRDDSPQKNTSKASAKARAHQGETSAFTRLGERRKKK